MMDIKIQITYGLSINANYGIHTSIELHFLRYTLFLKIFGTLSMNFSSTNKSQSPSIGTLLGTTRFTP